MLSFIPKLGRGQVNIGYFSENAPIIFMILSCLGIITNIIFVISYLIRILKGKKNKLSSLEKIMLGLSLSETGISICWFLSAYFYPTNKLIRPDWSDKETEDYYKSIPSRGGVNFGCSIIADVQIFCYVVDWLFISFSIIQVKDIILNPIEAVLNAKKKIRNYLIFSFILGTIVVIVTEIGILYGKSPLITCSLRIDLTKRENIYYFGDETHQSDRIKIIYGYLKIGTVLLICCIPLVNIGLAIYNTIKIYTNPDFENDEENRKFLKSYFRYIITYLITCLLFFSLYIIDLFVKVKGSEDSKPIIIMTYFKIVSLIFCLTPCIVGIIRISTTSSLQRFISSSICKKKKINDINLTILAEEINDFESKSISKFISNIYLSISFCLLQKNNKYSIDEELSSKYASESIEYSITKDKIVENNLENEVSNLIDFKCIDFAPRIFNKLRKLDNINDEQMVNSFLPSKNCEGIKESEGRGGSFFLTTDDKKYMIKTIIYEELELIRKKFIQNFVEYINNNNKNSIIGRIYGVYKIQTNASILQEKEMIIIVMKNVCAGFEKNIVRRYDMKGSKRDREVIKNNDDPGNKKVLKDIDFEKLEKCLLLPRFYIKRLTDIMENDSKFFCDLGIMDYSLLVIKLEINEDEMKFIFGNEYQNYIDKEIDEIKNNIENESIDVNDDNNFDYCDSKNYTNNIRFPNDKFVSLRKYFFPCLNTKYMYIISIIDFLQLYNLKKNIETKLKNLNTQIEDISSVPPDKYQQRFEKYSKEITNKDNIVLKIREEQL